MPSIIAIDSGLTVTKAVVFDINGTPLAVARKNIPHIIPKERHIERDMTFLWQQTADAIKQALSQSGRDASDVQSIAATAHGDGLYLLDANLAPLGNGMLSLDSRGHEVIEQWRDTPLFEQALSLTGQIPHASAPSTLLVWIQQNQPERFAKIHKILSCKDWLTFCLTGVVGTDLTEGSTSFTDIHTQKYSKDAMALYGLDGLYDALPEMRPSDGIAGHINATVAGQTGLLEGTPVACGIHDVTASSLGIGGYEEGTISVIAGTYSINEIISKKPKTHQQWFCRNGIEYGTWNNMSISPASSANYEWFMNTFCQADMREAEANNQSIHTILGDEIKEAMDNRAPLFFHPYLFGSPHGSMASASFTGMQGWHNRGHILLAILEGIAFNHAEHVRYLQSGFDCDNVCLTGGVSRNPVFCQMLANILNMPISVPAIDETASLGVALCAGSAVGVYDSPQQQIRTMDLNNTVYQPDADGVAYYQNHFDAYREITQPLKSVWQNLDSLSAKE